MRQHLNKLEIHRQTDKLIYRHLAICTLTIFWTVQYDQDSIQDRQDSHNNHQDSHDNQASHQVSQEMELSKQEMELFL